MRLLDVAGLPWRAARRLLQAGLRTLARNRLPRNPALAEAFKAFNKERSPASRRAFYDALLSSRLIVAAKAPRDGGPVEIVELAIGAEGGLVAFSHPDALDRTMPEWSGTAAVEGRLLFQLASGQKRDFVVVDLFGERLVFKGPDLGRLASGELPSEDPAPARLSGPGQTEWSRPEPPPSEILLRVLREEAASRKICGCYLLAARLDDGAKRTALVFRVRDEAGLAEVRGFMQAADRRLEPADWGGPVHVVAMTADELEPLRPLAVLVRD
ncbi:MAG: SseB family protein [Elusimicrobia bacterium]|nr:SseB family protein [Elusimicrobiota bacterium]